MEAAWKVRASDDEDELLDTLSKVVRFVRQQRGEHAAAVEELTRQIYEPDIDTAQLSVTKISSPKIMSAESAVHIPMMSPSALSDRPSDGGPPPISTFNWRDMPTAVTPDLAGKKAADGTPMAWEMIPPGEQ